MLVFNFIKSKAEKDEITGRTVQDFYLIHQEEMYSNQIYC